MDGFLVIELLMFNFFPLSTNLVVVLTLFGCRGLMVGYNNE